MDVIFKSLPPRPLPAFLMDADRVAAVQVEAKEMGWTSVFITLDGLGSMSVFALKDVLQPGVPTELERDYISAPVVEHVRRGDDDILAARLARQMHRARACELPALAEQLATAMQALDDRKGFVPVLERVVIGTEADADVAALWFHWASSVLCSQVPWEVVQAVNVATVGEVPGGLLEWSARWFSAPRPDGRKPIDMDLSEVAALAAKEARLA